MRYFTDENGNPFLSRGEYRNEIVTPDKFVNIKPYEPKKEMIDVQEYIDRLDFLKEVLNCWIDHWMEVGVMQERRLDPFPKLPQMHYFDKWDFSYTNTKDL